MSSMILKPPGDELVYEQIEGAVRETARGRWFLDEFARRNRHADTLSILAAVETLNGVVRSQRVGTGGGDGLRGDIVEMARAIAETERDLRSMRPEGAAAQYSSASDELDSVVGTTEQATSAILSAAERVQEHAWTARENGSDLSGCDLLDACATEIYTACAFQDVTAQRIRKVVGTIRFLDQRLKSMLAALGVEESEAAPVDTQAIGIVTPSLRPEDIWMSDANQAEVDDTFDFFVPAAQSEPTMIGAEEESFDFDDVETGSASLVAPHAAEVAKPDTMADALAPFEAGSTADKLRAFR